MTDLSPPAQRFLGWVAGIAALALAAMFAVHLHTRLGRELRDMPETERRALYERTVETLRTSCLRSSGATFTEYCREQAVFIESFPDCDSECHRLARRFIPKPTR